MMITRTKLRGLRFKRDIIDAVSCQCSGDCSGMVRVQFQALIIQFSTRTVFVGRILTEACSRAIELWIWMFIVDIKVSWVELILFSTPCRINYGRLWLQRALFLRLSDVQKLASEKYRSQASWNLPKPRAAQRMVSQNDDGNKGRGICDADDWRSYCARKRNDCVEGIHDENIDFWRKKLLFGSVAVCELIEVKK